MRHGMRYPQKPKRRYNVWKKIWTWLKKYGGYIAAFVGGIAAYFFIDRNGDKRADEHLISLNNRLAEYKELVERLEYNIGQLTRNLNSMEATSGELAVENNKLRDIIGASQRDVIDARHAYTDLADRLESAEGDIDKLGDIERGLDNQSVKLDKGFKRLEEFLQKYGTTTDIL